MKTIDTIAVLWFGLINVLALLMFGLDKWRAENSRSRVSEMKLVLLAASGGWAGGLLGMKLFRHKTAKPTFKLKYALALVPFIAEIWAWQHWR